MPQPRFTVPTLVSITAPTCAGKNHLLEALVSELGFARIVSTTDRPARVGEVEGVHYNFISTEESKRLEADGKLAELITYNGTRYGVTHAEMEKKIHGEAPPIVILEPQGLEIYRQYCRDHGWGFFNIFVHATEEVRLQRLVQRTGAELMQVIQTGSPMSTYGQHQEFLARALLKVVDRNNKRLKAVLDEERHWGAKSTWDVTVDGTDTQKALESVIRGVLCRNSKMDILS